MKAPVKAQGPKPKVAPARTVEDVDSDLRRLLFFRTMGLARGEQRNVRVFDDLLDERLVLTAAAQ